MSGTDFNFERPNPKLSERQLEAAGWGVFFVWIGIALLAHLGWSIGLVGVGIIMLLVQLVRYELAFGVERFAAIVGVLFILGGIFERWQIHFGLVPILCIIAGLALLTSALTGRGKLASRH